ncbi:MAG: hypothetical protein AB7N24_24035 [Dehalococcoidia bacterium]
MIAAIALLLSVSDGADWSAYKPVPAATAWVEAAIVEGSDFTIEAANVKYTITAPYTGEHREMLAPRRELYRRWAKALGHPPSSADLCSHEIEIRVGTDRYWLPLQNVLLGPFAAEAVRGSRLQLRIMYIGAVGAERVFMINSFEVRKP